MNTPHDIDIAVEAVKIAPPAVVSSAIILGMTVDQWIATLTLIYLIGLILHQLPKHVQGAKSFWRWLKSWRQKRD